MSRVMVSGSRLPVRPSASDRPDLDRDQTCPAARLFVNGHDAATSTPTTRVDGRQRLHRDRDAADQPAAADRNDDRIDRRKILEQLEADRARAGDDVRVRVRRNEEAASAARVCLRLPLRLVIVRALAQLGAGGANGVDLRARRVGRDEDRQRKLAARARRTPARGRGCPRKPSRAWAARRRPTARVRAAPR